MSDIDKRRYERVELKGYIADIADGHFIFGGIIEDVSLDGLRLNDLPVRFGIDGKQYRIVVSGGPSNKHFKLTVFPCWKDERGSSMDVGFEVVENNGEWKTFVKQLLPDISSEEDVWDQYSAGKR